MMLADLVALPVLLALAFMLRLGEMAAPVVRDNLWLFALTAVVGVLVLGRLGLYRAVVRYMGNQALVASVSGALLLALFLWGAAFVVQVAGFPRSVPLIFALLLLVYLAGSRELVRLAYRRVARRAEDAEPVVVYGAGEAGMRLSSALIESGRFRLISYLDEDSGLQGSVVGGVPVHSPDRIGSLIERYAVRRVLLAIPGASHQKRRQILDKLAPLPVRIQTIPGMDELLVDGGMPDGLQELDVADLLGRDPVPADETLLRDSVTGKVVMVTGAAGSIGSELCRLIATLSPERLVLLDQSEVGLYHLEQEFSERALDFPVHPLLGSVLDAELVGQAIHDHGVETVYHAAAYKHVPLLESNLLSAVRNNVLGTQVLLDAVLAAGCVERFVLISTDKAVRPTNIMGATKRAAEMILQCAARDAGDRQMPALCMVRFGNVLGSSGSVVPRFHRQIEAGGPVTVTHPEVMRYFMTPQEAAELVIQAGSMGESGEVFLLEMGEPVRILDLARRMILLHGLQERTPEHPDGDIAISFTGLRPGEKLYEELLIDQDVAIPTAHPRIAMARDALPDCAGLGTILCRLFDAVERSDVPQVHSILLELVPEYRAAVRRNV
ncbi:MAG: polysaccharide biosynthesis protein [Halothiobacillaceae bacterium]